MKVSEVLIILSCVFVVTTVALNWQNLYDRYLDFECPSGQAISRIVSKHSNHHEDRRWSFTCQPTPITSCRWHWWVNEFDGILDFQCPNSGAIAGVKGTHDNSREDRRFSFRCCKVSVKKRCTLSGWANNWDARMNFGVASHQYIRGAFSVHDNGREDRRWKFEVCS